MMACLRALLVLLAATVSTAAAAQDVAHAEAARAEAARAEAARAETARAEAARAGAAEAAAPRRVALIIGNARYDHVDSLANPGHDAVAMESALAGQGFETFVGTDLDRAAFKALLAKFKKTAEGADTVLVHYSGHAFQLDGRNHLVPSDARLETVDAIASQTLRLDTLIGDLQARGRQLLVFLDACRNNPLPVARRTENGLAQVATGNGVFVAFATQPGNISYDGRSKLSPFTRAIVRNIGKPGRSVSDLMIEVRNDVERSTLHQQTPWDQSSLKRQFYFAPLPQRDGEPGTGTELASLPAGSDLATQARTAIAPGITARRTEPTAPNVIELDEAPAAIFGREDLVLAVQGELKRIGCYRADVDGAWGPGSRGALREYYKTRKLNPTDTEPTQFHLDNLKRETGTVCVYVPPKPKRRATTRRKAKPAQSRPAKARPSKARPSKARANAKSKRRRKATRTAAAPRARARPARKRAAPKRRRKSLANVAGFR